MNRIDAKFAQLRAQSRKALVPFITAGDPALEATVPVMQALVEAGADVIELGVPFSDPMADGPTIQRSSERALARGAGRAYVFDCVRRFREHDGDTPVVLMGYLNPVEIRGAARYAAEAAEAGVDGLLLVDLPPEEATAFRAAFSAVGLQLIALASPTTTDERLAMLAAEGEGYLYYVSMAGVTGAAGLDPASVSRRVAGLRRQSRVPVLVGFGIRDAASAAALAPAADGVVVGSALVERLAAADDAAQAARDFLTPLRAALDAAAADSR
ncbi:MAG TPA: tryptophan synthase subunit alpha [Arenimonas sp.]|nr:tryptophan synthase subunit alpha [Arenimonas sp.]